MNRSFLAGVFSLAMAGCSSAALAEEVGQKSDTAAPVIIRIVNPDSTGVAWNYLIDDQAQTLAAGYSQQIDSSCTITFDRGGGLGESKYTLSEGTYTFTWTDDHWDLYNTENTPAGDAVAGIGTTDEGTTTTADPVTPVEKKMFQEMYSRAGLDAASMKLVEEDWQGKTHAQRKTDHDSFMAQIQAAQRGAQGASVALFDGTTLNGWHLRDPDGPNYWSAQGGELVGTPQGNQFGKNLVSDQLFGDFELQLEFLMETGANSGVYLRGLYEVQLFDDFARTLPAKERCGAIWKQVAPSEQAYLGPGEWNTLNVKMVGQRVTVTMNGKRIVEDAIPSGPTDHQETLNIAEGDPGPIMLQCHPGGAVRFRNISIAAVAQPSVLSADDKRMFWEMYRGAGLDQAALKMVSEDWKSKTSTERKAEYDGFMKQVEQMRQAANKPTRQENDLP